MSKAEELQKVQEKIINEIPGVIACALVSAEDSLPLAGKVKDPEIDLDLPSSYYNEAFRAVRKAYEAVGWGNPLEVLIVGEEINVLLMCIKPGKVFQGVAFTNQANLGFVRAVVKKYREVMLKLLP